MVSSKRLQSDANHFLSDALCKPVRRRKPMHAVHIPPATTCTIRAFCRDAICTSHVLLIDVEYVSGMLLHHSQIHQESNSSGNRERGSTIDRPPHVWCGSLTGEVYHSSIDTIYILRAIVL